MPAVEPCRVGGGGEGGGGGGGEKGGERGNHEERKEGREGVKVNVYYSVSGIRRPLTM